jgi:hypothetical protein
MAQTKKQAEKELLKQAQALLAKQKKQLANLQSQQESLNPTPTRVNTTTLAGIQAASQPTVVAQTDDEAWARKKVGTTGKTQAQLDAAAGAADVVKMINESYSGLGITSKIDPKTGMVVTTKTDGTVLTNNPPGSPFAPAAPVEDEPEKKEISDATRDAFAALTDLFASYGLESLAGEIAGYMTQGLTASEALIKLKTNPTGAYAKRFAGNFARVKNGLNAISEAAYIGLENSYASTLKAYGLGNMVSLNREDNYKKFADYIAGDISADEFKDRVDTVVTRVQNADASIKSTLKAFYPEITDADLIGYFLNPKENLPKLQEKVTASEIGAAATGMGLATNVGTATDLARYGIDKAEAREGYSTIAGVLPTATKLGDIYNETGVRYAQAEGEAEVFKGSQDAATKRKRLASMERAAFSGSSGTGQSSLTRSTQGLL